MNAGKLSERITIDRSVVTKDDAGGEIVNWTPFATVWASIDPRRAREQLIANQILAATDTLFLLRWSRNVDQMDETWRLRNGGRIYDIKSILQKDMGQREIWIAATSGLNDG